MWGVFPRIKVWNMQHIRKAGRVDRLRCGDYGVIGLLDVAYGEHHPKQARDTEGPATITQYPDLSNSVVAFKDRRRRAPNGGRKGNLASLTRRGAGGVEVDFDG